MSKSASRGRTGTFN